jgi:Fe-S-cluster containining protein
VIPCTQCGACCVAPDIAALDKPLGLACPHLGPDALCTIYEQRPQVCRDYQPDQVCLQIAADSLEERVSKYLALFGLTTEAAVVKRARLLSMKQARSAVRVPEAP